MIPDLGSGRGKQVPRSGGRSAASNRGGAPVSFTLTDAAMERVRTRQLTLDASVPKVVEGGNRMPTTARSKRCAWLASFFAHTGELGGVAGRGAGRRIACSVACSGVDRPFARVASSARLATVWKRPATSSSDARPAQVPANLLTNDSLRTFNAEIAGPRRNQGSRTRRHEKNGFVRCGWTFNAGRWEEPEGELRSQLLSAR